MTKTMRKTGWVIGAVAVAAIGAYALAFTGGGEGPRPEPGDCASIEGKPDQPRYRVQDCGSELANVKVAKVVDDARQCPKGDSDSPYSAYTSSVTLCLIPNFVEGGCYHHDQKAVLRKVACTTPNSVKVVRVAQDTTTTCEGRSLSYPEPAVTFCLARVGG